MNVERLIPLSALCTHYHVQMSFFSELNEVGLIEISTIEQAQYIHPDRMGEVERLIRLHQDLNVNLEGIDVVCNLLKKVEELQSELREVRSRLRLYEG